MAERIRPHIFVEGPAIVQPFRPPPRRITPRRSYSRPNRGLHGQYLRESAQAAQAEGEARTLAAGAYLGSTEGSYVTFRSVPDIELVLESLDPRQGNVHPELRVVTQVQDAQQAVSELATVFVPQGKMAYFQRRISEYIASANDQSVQHRKLLDRIQAISLASLEALWTDGASSFPGPGEIVWWEVWLVRENDSGIESFRGFVEAAGMEIARRSLSFRDRAVVNVRGSREQWASALDKFDGIAELRQPSILMQSIAAHSAVDQRDWVDNLLGRLQVADVDAPAVCIIDTGVDRGNPLLTESLLPSDCHAGDAAWSADDRNGHGTEMGGLALYGDLGEALNAMSAVQLRHRLESVKLLDQGAENDPDLYGALTATSVSRVEIQAPGRARIFCMAVTSSSNRDDIDDRKHGQPTSWSAAVDALAAGSGVAIADSDIVLLDDVGEKAARLFVIAAGNIELPLSASGYPDRNDLEPILDPGQAWNAITVGASTQLDVLDRHDQHWHGWSPMAPRGELSPFSRTSVMFAPGWPYKPDVVFEGAISRPRPI